MTPLLLMVDEIYKMTVRKSLPFVLTLSIALATVFLTGLGLADASLKQDMKEIGSLFKEIARTASDRTQNRQNAESARSLIALFKDAQTQTPDSVVKLPIVDQGAAFATFQNLIQKEVDFSIALAAAFTAGDNQLALTILKEMADIRNQGHSTYE